MSQLLEIQERLQDTTAAIAQMEKAAVIDPSSLSIVAMRKSLETRLQRLEAEFMAVANRAGIDVCSYRLFSDDKPPRLASLATTLGAFQKLVSTVYSAVKHGPKQRATFGADDADATAFQFAYSFPGSVGFVLAIDNERLLLGETDLDEAVEIIFDMVEAETSDDVAPFANRLGHGPVRALYNWVNDHARTGLGADIDWRRDQTVRTKAFIQPIRFTELREAIERTGEAEEEEIVLTGELLAVNLVTKTFRMQFESGEDIAGKFDDAVGDSHRVELPKRYTATLTKTTRVVYSLDEDESTYFLSRIEEPSA